jgi:cyclophilin family peptidyl-prolyl cis-trans isomerase
VKAGKKRAAASCRVGVAWCLVVATWVASGVASAASNPIVVISTSLGAIEVELLAESAPRTVENFLTYAAAGHYDGTIFHRVVKGHFIQGGGLTPDLRARPTRPPIPNEAKNGEQNRAGTLAMMRRRDPDSATSQFLVNLRDNPFLDHRGDVPHQYGYAVFGRVTAGMDVVERIDAVSTTRRGIYLDVPVDPVVIESVRIRGER